MAIVLRKKIGGFYFFKKKKKKAFFIGRDKNQQKSGTSQLLVKHLRKIFESIIKNVEVNAQTKQTNDYENFEFS